MAMQNYVPKQFNNGSETGPPVFVKIVLYVVAIHVIILGAWFIYKLYNPQPTTAQGYQNLAKALIAQGNYKKAYLMTQKALALDNNFAKSYIDLGNIYIFQGDYIQAEKAYNLALDYIGQDVGNLEVVYYNLGSVYEKERKIEDSWECFVKAYQMRSVLAGQYWEKAANSPVQFVIKNDREGFVRNVTNNSDLPEEVHRREHMVRKYLDVNNKKVVEESDKYLQDNPGSRYSYLFRALMTTALLNLNQTQEAVENLNLLENQDLPRNYVAWLKHTRAYIFYHKKDFTEALAYLQDIVNNYPEYKLMKDVRAMIEDIQREVH